MKVDFSCVLINKKLTINDVMIKIRSSKNLGNHMAKLNYHHLQYFHAIATHGSIAEASRAMHITPQTLSAQLNLLEAQLGYSLFIRKGKRLVLNDMGHITLSYAQEIFSLGDELIHSLKNHSTDFSFRFSIGVTDVIAKVFSFNLLKNNLHYGRLY